MGFPVAAVFAVLLLSAAGASGSELVDSALSPEEVVERLKEVRKGWEEVEIEYVVYERRLAFYGPEPRLKEGGRLALTPGDCGELEAFPVDEQRQKQDSEPEVRIVWTPDDFQVTRSGDEVLTVARSELPDRNDSVRARLEQPDKRRPAGMLERLFPILVVLIPEEWDVIFPESPKDCLPLVYAEDAEVLAERFDLTVMENDESVFLFARPGRLEDQRSYQQTAICIDRETFIPIGKRTVLPRRVCYTWVVTSLRVNGEEVEVSLSRE